MLLDENEETGKRGADLRRGWVSQPVGRGDLAPTINGALRPICHQDSGWKDLLD